jgi:hypothetical protein
MYKLPPLPPKKTPKPFYHKSAAVKELELLANRQARLDHPGVDQKYLAPRTFRDDTANALTACIVRYAFLCGYFASRLNNTGIYRNGKYTRSTARRGLPDILITGKDGTSIFVEVKVKKDRMSEHQVRVRQEQERSGGMYFVASDFASFKTWFDTL